MDWVRGEKLGHGSFATVSLAAPTKQSSLLPPLMAVKSCGVSHSSSLMNEKLILEDLKDCPEVITCFGERFSNENGEKLYNVLLEYAAGGTLADKLENSVDLGLPESEVRHYTKALLKGLNYIHKFGYVHCDIKLQNILLCRDGAVKIADFGLAKRASTKFDSQRCELRGTPMYMSPEMVYGGDQGAPADIWALGCAVSEMVAGSPAWMCSDVASLLMRIGVGEEVPEIPGILSKEGRDFIEKCFAKNPTERWTAEMLLDHPFVQDQNFDYDGGAAAAAMIKTASSSPRCPFDFPEWVSSSAACSITSLPSSGDFPESGLWFSEESNLKDGSWSSSAFSTAEERLRGLVTDKVPDWSVSGDWVTVR